MLFCPKCPAGDSQQHLLDQYPYWRVWGIAAVKDQPPFDAPVGHCTDPFLYAAISVIASPPYFPNHLLCTVAHDFERQVEVKSKPRSGKEASSFKIVILGVNWLS